MILQTTVVGYIPTNAYFYIDDTTKHGFLIDPGAEPDKLMKIIKDHDFTIEKILLTHGHFDHIGAVNRLQDELAIPVVMQKNGIQYAQNPAWNLSAQTDKEIILPDVLYLADNTEIFLQANKRFRLRMIPVPGHTLDGCLYYDAAKHIAFVGDSIFLQSYGRTDLPGGDEQQLMTSIIQNILTLPDDTQLLSGHSEPTTVRAEKARPWFRGFSKSSIME